MKKIKMNDIDLEMNCGTTMYLEIDVFRFVKDESLPWIEIEIEEGGEYKFLEELEGSMITTHEELRKVAIRWLFDNVFIKDKEV